MDNIIRSYKRKEFDKITEENLMRFLGAQENCTVDRLLASSAKDIKILKSWENWFRGKGLSTVKSPYVIQQVGRVLYLWKERKA